MKKLMLVATVAVGVLIHQSAKAQVSLSLHIGPQPYYAPAYYDYNSYYVPTRTVVYHQRPVVYHQKRYVNYRPAYRSSRVYRTSYNRPSNHYYAKSKSHGFYGKSKGHGGNGKGHGRGRH